MNRYQADSMKSADIIFVRRLNHVSMKIHTKYFLTFLFFLALNLAAFTLAAMGAIDRVWAPILTLMSLPLAYLVIRRLTTPLETLQTKAADLLAQYNLEQHLSLPADEMEALEWNITLLGERIKQLEREALDHQDLMKNLNQEFEAKIEERTLELEEKNVRLRMISEELGRSFARIDDEMKVLGRMQKSLLPEPAINIDGMSMRSFYMPTGRAGGDYYDVIAGVENETFLLVADVSGHGSPAAFIMGIARSMVHSEAQLHRSPGAVLDALNRVLVKTLRNGEFVTMFLGRFDHETMTFTYTNAGHPPPLFFRNGESRNIELFECRGLPLGVMDHPAYEETQLTLTPGDRMILYTDGLVETQNDKQLPYGPERLRNMAESQRAMTNEDLLDTLVLDLEMFVDRPLDIEPLEDDATIMIVDFLTAPLETHETSTASTARA